MNRHRLPVAALVAALLSGAAAAQDAPPPPEPEQLSAPYRGYHDVFAAFARQRARYPLLRMRLLPRPAQNVASLEGLTLAIHGTATAVSWPADALAGASLPMLQEAYDEDAVLRLNRPRGSFTLGTQVAITARADGLYSAAFLQDGCGQLLDYIRASSLLRRVKLHGTQCAGVVFRYWKGRADAGVNVGGRPLPAHPMRLLAACHACEFDNFIYRFAEWPREMPVAARGQPDVIDIVLD